MLLKIAPDLIQHYFLDVDPRTLDATIGALHERGQATSARLPEVGPWSIYFWLERPALWILRPVRITSGLDAFLIEDGGVPGVIDVAEAITHVLADPEQRGGIANSWSEFISGDAPSGLLFAAFLWLNWDALPEGKSSPDGESIPPSSILAALRRSLGASAADLAQRRGRSIRLLLTGTTGDADLMLYGLIEDTQDLDECLCMVNQHSWTDLVDQADLALPLAEVRSRHVVQRSRTELAVAVDLYREMLQSRSETPDLVRAINARFGGNLLPETALLRGGGAITEIHDRISAVVGDRWTDRPVFGRDDFVVGLATGSASGCGLGDLLDLHARLDAARIANPAFPKRHSLRLGFSAPSGRAAGPRAQTAPEILPPSGERLDAGILEAWSGMIRDFGALRWREDLRIIERVAERCIILQKSETLPRETRRMVRVAFERFGKICQRIQEFERELENMETQSPEAGHERRKAELAGDIRIWRSELHNSGASLERVLTHHSRGVAALLLHPAIQARGASHFASEIALSDSLGVLFRSPALRLRDYVRSVPCAPRCEVWRDELAERLDLISTPIIYASHEPDFNIRAGLTLLRVPTWGLWQPTTHAVHEWAHALAVVGSLHYLARKILSRAGGGPLCPCPQFEEKIAALGLHVARPGAWEHTAPLAGLATEYFRSRDIPHGQGLPIARRDQKEVLEEIIADVVERLLSYPAGERGDRAHLCNSLPSIVPYAVRRNQRPNRDRVFRLFAAQLAVRYTQTDAPHLLSAEGARLRDDLARDHAALFSRWIKQWFAESLGGAGSDPRDAVGQMMADLGHACAEDLNSFLNAYARFAHLCAVILSLGPVTDTTYQSLSKATLAFSGLLPLARAAEAQTAQTEALAAELAEGRVPTVVHPLPERLVAALLAHFQPGPRATIPPHARFALSRYLANLHAK